jgi:hypothetical protein
VLLHRTRKRPCPEPQGGLSIFFVAAHEFNSKSIVCIIRYDLKRTIVDINQRPCDGDSSLRSCLARLHGSIKLPHLHPLRSSLSSGTTTTTDGVQPGLSTLPVALRD